MNSLPISGRSGACALGLAAVALSLIAAQPASAQSAPVPPTAIKLFNTGVKNDGTVAAIGATDLHYTQVTPAGNPSAFVFNVNNSPYAAPTNSQYISPDQNGGTTYNGGGYTVGYQTSFDLTGLNPATALISGDWSTDNLGNDILINGISTGLTSGGFTSFTHFNLAPFAADFQSGLNTLTFVWTNQGYLGALDVQNLQGTAVSAPVPEASTTVSLGLMLALGLGGIAIARKKRTA